MSPKSGSFTPDDEAHLCEGAKLTLFMRFVVDRRIDASSILAISLRTGRKDIARAAVILHSDGTSGKTHASYSSEHHVSR